MKIQLPVIKAVSSVAEKAAAVIPMHLQIKGAHLLQKAKKTVMPNSVSAIPVFEEIPIVDVSTLAIEDIDVSNPFLFRQNLW